MDDYDPVAVAAMPPVPEGRVRLCEYGQTEPGTFARRKILKSRTGDFRRVYQLYHAPRGYYCAGSMARWQDKELWGVQFQEDGATHGRMFLTEQKARDLFKEWTKES